MKFTYLPKTVDIDDACRQNLRLEGLVSINDLDRLKTIVMEPSGSILSALQFSHDTQNRQIVTGTLSGKLEVRCERCLGSMTWALESDFCLYPVKSLEQAKLLPKNLDPIIIQENGNLGLHFMLEDEIMLNLPLILRHEPNECSVSLAPASAITDSERKQPFKGLASLMNREE